MRDVEKIPRKTTHTHTDPFQTSGVVQSTWKTPNRASDISIIFFNNQITVEEPSLTLHANSTLRLRTHTQCVVRIKIQPKQAHSLRLY